MALVALPLVLAHCITDDPGGGPLPDTAGDLGGDAPLGGTWVDGPRPCNRANAWWFDDRERGFAGCGEDAAGQVLWRTTDGGQSWDRLTGFDDVRVNDVRRGPDGVLYGAGRDTVNNWSLWVFDDTSPDFPHEGLYTPSLNAFTTVNQARTVAVTQDGQLMINSLTGRAVAYRPAGAVELVEYPGVGDDYLTEGGEEPSAQPIRRLRAHENGLYAIGGSLTTSASVFLPSRHPQATFEMTRIRLQPEDQAGDVRDLYIWSETEMLAVGHDQTQRLPLIVVSEGDPYDVEHWSRVWLSDFGIDFEGLLWALSVQGDTVVAVGERIPTAAGGFAIFSQDRGRTWAEITPPGMPPTHNVWLFENGDIVMPGRTYFAE